MRLLGFKVLRLFGLYGMGQILVDEDYLNELRYRAEHDILTGVLNRYGGDLRMRQILQERKPGYLVLADIDKFKQINDVYGHDTGDKVLKAIAASFVAEVGDDVVRIGGDEFGFYYNIKEKQEDLQEVFDRLFERIDSIVIPELEGEKPKISVGATYYDGEKEMSFKTLYHSADRLCYKSKATVGNKVTIE